MTADRAGSALFLIRERMLRPDLAQTWEQFVAANPDLLTWERGSGILAQYYRSETPASPTACTIFLLPDAALRG